MGDPFRPASTGDPLFPRLKADWFNGVNQAVNAIRGGDIDLAQQMIAGVNHAANYLTVRVVNKSASAINRPGGVLKINGLNFVYADKPKQVFDRPIMKGVTPSSADDDFVVLTKPLKINQPGEGVTAGYVFCRLNYTDEDKEHDKAAPTSSVTYLTSGTEGVPILWRELEDEMGSETTGEQWALVMKGLAVGSSGSSTEWFGRVTEAIGGAIGWAKADAGSGMVQEVDEDGDDVGDPKEVYSRYFNTVPAGIPVYCTDKGDGTHEFKRAGCSTGP
jgi:hypothetical protein